MQVENREMEKKRKKEVLDAEVMDDIFAEAAKQSINIDTLVINEKSPTKANVDLPISKKVRKNWSELKIAIDNEHAKRFNDILNNLPDREFTRTYLKALEFFKPKVIRQAGGRGEVVDQTINIQINYGNKNPIPNSD